MRTRWALVWLVLAVSPAWGDANAGPAPLRVAVSVAPQQMLVERIGGPAVEVQTLVAPGHSPATYEPTPRQIARFAAVELYFSIGVPFEQSWLPRLRAVNAGMAVVSLSEAVAARPNEARSDHDHAHAGGTDPHVWTDPLLLIQMADQVRDQLVKRRPALRSVLARNHAALVAELRALDAEIRAQLKAAETTAFLVYHPAWGHFAERYGLQQIAIEKGGKAPGSRSMAQLIDRAKRDGLRLIITQPQFDDRAARRLARILGARLASVDPLSQEVIANLRRLAKLIATGDPS